MAKSKAKKKTKKSSRVSKKRGPGEKYLRDRPVNHDPVLTNLGGHRLTYGKNGLEIEELKFKSSEFARSQGNARPTGSFDACLQRDLVAMRTHSRDMYENNEIYQTVVDRSTECGVGAGFDPIIDTGDDELDLKIRTRWELFKEAPEIRGDMDWKECLEKVWSGMLIDGDIGASLLTNKPQFQIFEGNEIGNGSDLGVILDSLRKPIAYKVHGFTKTGRQSSKFKEIPAERFAFVANYLYPSASRGVPKGQAITPSVFRLKDILDSEAITWQVNSRQSLIINRSAPLDDIEQFATKKDDPENDDPKKSSLYTQETEQGTVHYGQPGDKVESVANNRPGGNFEKSVFLYTRIIGLPFGLPLPIIMFDWKGLNYSTMRGLIEQSGKNFVKIQLLIIRQFCRKVFKWKLEQWMAGKFGEDRLEINDEQKAKLLKSVWTMAKFPWVDQLKESEAQGDMLDRGFTTQQEIAKGRDKDYIEIRKQRKKEFREAWEDAVELEKETNGGIPATFSWRLLAGLKELGKTAQAAVVNKDDENKDDDDENEND